MSSHTQHLNNAEHLLHTPRELLFIVVVVVVEGVPLVSWHFGDRRVTRGWPEGAGRSTAELSGLREDRIRGPGL